MARFNSSQISTTISGATTVGSPYTGAFTELTGTAPYTVTLANPALFPGVNQQFYNATSGTVTLSTPSGNFVGTGGTAATTVPVYAGNVVSVTADGTNYIVISEDGSALTATSATISGTLTVQSTGAVAIAPSTTGNIDNVNIGATTKASGAFNTLTANNAVTFTANTASSSTSTGTVVITGGLGVSGTINATSVSASLTGTLQTAAQANITSVGTLSSLTVSGNILSQAATTASAGSIQVTASDASLRLKWTSSPVADKNTWEVRSIGTGATPYLQFRTINDANTVFTDRVAFTNDGNVGIGTATPSAQLHVTQATGAGTFQLGSNAGNQYQYINIGGNTGGDNAWQLGKADTSGSIAPSQAFYLYDLKNTATRVVVNTSGNVGIGTNNPSYQIHNYLNSNQSIQTYTQNPNTGANAFVAVTAASNLNEFTMRSYGSGFTTFSHGGQTLASWGEIWAGTLSGAGPSGILIGTDNSSPIVFATSNTARALIDSSGNFGVGRTTIQASSGSQTIEASGCLITGGPLGSHQTNRGILEFNGGKVALRAYGATAGTGYLAFSVGGGGGSTDYESLRIDSSGNLLIQPYGASGAGANSAVSPPYLQFNGFGWNTATGSRTIGYRIQSVNAYWGGGGNNSPYGQTYPDLAFSVLTSDSSSYAEKMRLTGAGNLGIGTTSPTAKLHIQGTSGGGYSTTNKLILQRSDATNPTGSIEFQGSGGHTSPYWNILTDADQTNDWGVAYNGSKILQVLTNGHVGIGTTSPVTYLDVNPDSISYGYGGYVKFGRNCGTTSGAPVISVEQAGSASSEDFNLNALSSSYTNSSINGWGQFRILNNTSRSTVWNHATFQCGSGNINQYFRGDGNAYAHASWNSSGVDYAEYFESTDGSVIPVGTTVVLVDDKVRAATSNDNQQDILGVVRPKTMSKGPSVIGGGAQMAWQGKYLTDDFGQYIMEPYSSYEWSEEVTDSDGNTSSRQYDYISDQIPEGVVVPLTATLKTTDINGVPLMREKLNPEYDPTKAYEARESRPEWHIIGLLGQIPMIKGQPVGDRWRKMKTISDTVEMWYIR